MSSTSQERSSVVPSADPPRQIYLSEEHEVLEKAAIDTHTINSTLYYCGTGDYSDIGREVDAKAIEDHILGKSPDNATEVYFLKMNAQRFAHKRSYVWRETLRKGFRHELRNLVKLREKPHRHILTLMCSYTYTERKLAGVVLSPVGEFDLKTLLSMNTSNPDPNLQFKRTAIARWYGCSASALEYIHDTIHLKHKDIKLTNILVHGNNIKITDFGISNPVEDSSATSGPSAGTTYNKSPETLDRQRRGRRQDIWPLGCVFLEMETCRLGISLEEYHAYRGRYSIADQLPEIQAWIKKLLTITSDLEENSTPLS
ncbi:MAG: hypothetical protein M1835_000930 [Candelina submexicana]|nr:MAG: hypothetical protein M1835_000930 [Candelina submexicana]